jgi:hypothetical protein
VFELLKLFLGNAGKNWETKHLQKMKNVNSSDSRVSGEGGNAWPNR